MSVLSCTWPSLRRPRPDAGRKSARSTIEQTLDLCGSCCWSGAYRNRGSPDPILNLRPSVRLRHTLSEKGGEWQQRVQAVLCHHGCPQRRNLLTEEGLHGARGQEREPEGAAPY